MQTIRNPILPGFHPDPSICRVGDDFYIATSTFEWFGGVMIHHSRDLVHWRCLGPALTRTCQINLLGNPDSGGVWAPCLTHADGKFWLVYSDTKTWHQRYKDVHNYVVWCSDIEAGDWSDPHYLNASGFDPSLFHDTDGRKWVLNQLWDHRPENHSFAGIVMQEYDHATAKLVGPIRNIFRGTKHRVTEGPHLYKKDGWYYLVTAEGGTGEHHCVTVARSRTLEGPYEVHPENPILTSRGKPHLTLQKAGHASWCDTPAGEWYLVHLASRPVSGCSLLGRETCLQKIVWDDDRWPRLEAGGNDPQMNVPVPNLPPCPAPAMPAETLFDTERIPPIFQTLRIPSEEGWLSLTREPGSLWMRGQESLASRHRTSVLARRIQDFEMRAETTLDLAPTDHMHMAGLVAMYDVMSWYYLHLVGDDGARVLRLGIMRNGTYMEDPEVRVSLPNTGWVDLACEIAAMRIRFFVRTEGTDWRGVGADHDATILGDEFGDYGHFTGAFVGMSCQDVSGQGRAARFRRFAYHRIEPPKDS